MRAPAVLTTFFLLSSSAAVSAATVSDTTKAKVSAEYSQLPLSFELNEGQSDPQVKALARGSGYGLFLTGTESVTVVSPGHDPAVLRVRTVGSNPSPVVTGLDRLEGTSNYFIGNDPSKWRRNVATYGRIKYESIYPGVDLVYYGNQRQLEYDYVVSPGADPSSIRLAIEGARKLRIDSNGDLVMETKQGVMYHRKPVVYQEIEGSRREIAGNFVLRGHQVSFKLGEYNRQKPLVIDPSLTFITYLGGSGTDQGKGIVITSLSGFTLIGGSTSSTNFPTASPIYADGGGTDGFISAFNATGTALILSTYIGGSGDDLVSSIAIDSAVLPAMLYVAGTTTSRNFPTVSAAQGTYGGGGSDGFVTQVKLQIAVSGGNPTINTTIGFSTYLGGSGGEAITGAAMDQISKDVFVTGFTSSSNFPVTAGVIQSTIAGGGADAFAARYSSITGAQSFSTYLGGTGIDEANAIAVYTNLTNSTVTAYVTGVTTSSSLPTPPAGAAKTGSTPATTGTQAFLVALSGNGTSSPFTNLLGNPAAVTVANAVATDATGNIYVAGNTDDPTLPVLGAVQAKYAAGGNDAYVAAYNSSGTVTFLSYWGGSGYEKALGIGVYVINNADLTTTTNIFFGGYTTGSFPTASAVQSTYGGGASDGFVAMFTSSHGAAYTVGYSTYVGGSGADVVYGVAVGTSGNARVTGITNSTGLATTGSYQGTIGGGYDAFVAAIQTTP